MRFLPANLDGVLVELEGLDQALAFYRAVAGASIPGVVEVIPAARTVYMKVDLLETTVLDVVEATRELRLDTTTERSVETVEIPVLYDGEDLAAVGELCGMRSDEVVARHSGALYTVAFTGFAPGFAYLSGGDPALRVPRRSSPRTAVPPGTVALAGDFTGVYPRTSPGGWQLLGRTTAPMWDLARPEPALLRPGMRVRFRSVGAEQDLPEAPPRAVDADRRTVRAPALEVLRPGAISSLQDLGRPGHAAMGVSESGAMDRRSLRDANHLVGNPSGASAVEIAVGGFEARAHGRIEAALVGADLPIRVTAADGTLRDEVAGRPFALDDGETIALGAPRSGVYGYLAVRGSFAIAPVLGSQSTDVLSGVGPAPLSAGDVLPLGERAGLVVSQSSSTRPTPRTSSTPPEAPTEIRLDLLLGPRTDWCAEDSAERLSGQAWRVSPHSNRVGLRLAGECPIRRRRTDELPSEAIAAGSIQIPPSGQPILFMADHPVTGGYPVIGTVAPYDLDRAAQVPVGGTIRFRMIAGFNELDAADRGRATKETD